MTNAATSTVTANEVKEEYHDKPVPLAGRLGFTQPALVWSGFGIAYICMVIGGLIQQGLGTGNAILAIFFGNLILFAYSAVIGYANGKWGLNFPLTVKAVFGEAGAAIPIVIMAVLVTGWYAFQAWLTADILRVAFGFDKSWGWGVAAAVTAIIMGLPVIFGIRSMANLMKFALPLMLLFAAYYLITAVIPAGGKLFSTHATGSISFLTGVGMAWSTFVVSGTMTGDIVRYCRNGREAVMVTAVAFLFSNLPFMVLGALISAAIANPSVVYFLIPGSGLAIVALVGIAIFSNWSTCDACLYNATMGYSNAFKGMRWRTAAILGISGLPENPNTPPCQTARTGFYRTDDSARVSGQRIAARPDRVGSERVGRSSFGPASERAGVARRWDELRSDCEGPVSGRRHHPHLVSPV